jgi:hypothetical protein
MTEGRKVVLKGEFDATGVRTGTEQAKTAVRDLATDAAKQGRAAGEGLEKIGEGAAKGAKQAERELSNLQQSIQRATARIESAGQSQSQYFESLARQRGVSVDALQPYLAQLREVEARQNAANAALNQGAAAVQRVGQSAGQTRQALAQLPLQFQDIAVSLQAGQQPLTVLLQQGTQIAGTFGGVGEALKATGGFLAGLITPVNVLGAAVLTLGAGFLLGRREISETEKVLILTGQAAGVTGGQIGLLAEQLDRVGGTRARATEVLREFARAGELGAVNLQRFAAAAIALERAGGPAAEETAKAFAELGEKPLEASLKLTKGTNFLTTALLEQIIALEQQGRSVEAARLVQEEYARTAEDQTSKLLPNLGLVERAWRGIKDATKEAGDAILNIGRTEGTNEQIERLTARLTLNQQLGRGEARNRNIRSENDDLREQIRILEQAAGFEALNAQLLAEQGRQVQALGDFRKQGLQFLTSEQKLQIEIAKARELGAAAGLKQQEIEDRIAAIRSRAARNQSTGSNGNRELEEQTRLIDRLSGLTATYTKDVQTLAAARNAGRISEQQYIALINELVSQTPAAREAAKEQADALKSQAKAAEEAARANDRYLDSLTKSLGAARASADSAADQLIGLVAGAQALEELRTARLEDAAAELQRKAAIESGGPDGNSDAAAIYRAEAEELLRLAAIRRRIATASADQEVQAANDRAAKEAADAWQRTSDQISQSLTDAIIEGGVSGRDALERAFKSLVLRPIIQAAIDPLARQITGALGVPGAPGGTGAPGQPNAIGSFLSSETGRTLTSALSYADAFMSAKSGNWGEAIGTAAGQYLGGPAGAAIGKVIGQAADKLLRGGAGTPSVGSVVTADASGARTGGADPSGILRNLNQETDQALKLLAGQSIGILNTLAAATGSAAQFSALAKFTADGRDASFGDFTLSRAGRTVADIAGDQPDGARSFASDPRAGFEAFATDVAAITRQALADIDLPGFARKQIEALGADATLDDLAQVSQQIQATITAIGALRDNLEPLAGSLSLLAGASSESLNRLAELSGGFESLGGNISTFYSAFVSEADRAAAETTRISDALGKFGLQLPVTREEFADLVQAQIALGDAGQPALAALLGVAGSFDQLATRAEALQDQLSDALIGAAERFLPADQVLRLRTDRIRLDLADAGVQVSTEQLLGASAAQIQQFVTAFVATGNASAEAQIAVLNAASALFDLAENGQTASQTLSQREQFERRLLELQGNTAEIQRRDLLAVQDDYNRGLLEQIFALEGAQRAAQTFSSSLQGFFNTPDLQSLRGNTRRLSTDASGAFFEFDLNDFNQQRSLLTEADIPGIVARYDQATQDRVNSLLTGNPFFPSMFLDQVARTRVAIPDTRNDAARQAEQDRMAANAASAPEDPLLRAQRENTEAIKRLTGSLSDYLDSLNTSDILGLSPEEQQRNALAAFNASLNLARGGDTAALERLQADTQRAIETTRSAFGSGSEGSTLLQQIVAAVRELQEGLGKGISRVADATEGGIVVTARGLSAVASEARGTTAAVSQRSAADALAAQRLVGFDA